MVAATVCLLIVTLVANLVMGEIGHGLGRFLVSFYFVLVWKNGTKRLVAVVMVVF